MPTTEDPRLQSQVLTLIQTLWEFLIRVCKPGSDSGFTEPCWGGFHPPLLESMWSPRGSGKWKNTPLARLCYSDWTEHSGHSNNQAATTATEKKWVGLLMLLFVNVHKNAQKAEQGLNNKFSQVALEKSHNCFFLSVNHLMYLHEQSCFCG